MAFLGRIRAFDDGVRQFREIKNGPVITCTQDAPLYRRKDAYLSQPSFDELQASILSDRRLNQVNTLSGQNFAGTRGWVTKFTRIGLKEMFKMNEYQHVRHFLETTILSEANAFVLNVLLVPISTDKYFSSRTSSFLSGTSLDLDSVKMHVDDTLIKNHHAHQVTVLYLSVPDDMDGGELLLRYGGKERGVPDASSAPDALIKPGENSLIVFRGDAFHSVNRAVRNSSSASSSSAQPSSRVSLVLEQYVLGNSTLSVIPSFQELDPQNPEFLSKRRKMRMFEQGIKLLLTLALIWAIMSAARVGSVKATTILGIDTPPLTKPIKMGKYKKNSKKGK
eukprot:CAMPEP_0172595374 /NCGR_PEP_ID=MMETSP1068-20121228/14924_1 /TAXON_ID=35684 /ORGANISM="Pseudopedinella elastica, Strain CCMP716" /LENGTH=335 /DNA_ID=CAMNT_0013393865 /DNA_START=156 /DNA_END=1164 /DNA_ORIENTATION=-